MMKKRIIFLLVLAAVLVLACSSAFAECLLKNYVARLMDPDDHVTYYLANLEYGSMMPHDDYTPDFAPILLDAKITPLDGKLSPEGEYIVLAFPLDGIRFDFFCSSANMDYVRQNNPDGSEELFTITMPEDILMQSSEMMAYEVKALAEALGRDSTETIDLASGYYLWFSDRLVLDLTKSDSDGVYHIIVLDSTSAYDASIIWTFDCREDTERTAFNAFHVVCESADYSNTDEEPESEIIYDRECSTVFLLHEDLSFEILNSDDEYLNGAVLEMY